MKARCEAKREGTGDDTKGGGDQQQSENDYLLAEPRLAEAHDTSTIVHPTGADRSDGQQTPVTNQPLTQHVRDQTRSRTMSYARGGTRHQQRPPDQDKTRTRGGRTGRGRGQQRGRDGGGESRQTGSPIALSLTAHQRCYDH